MTAEGSPSKQPDAQWKGPEASASKQAQKQELSGVDGSVPRGESTPRVSRSMAALLFGAVGFVGIRTSGECGFLSVRQEPFLGKHFGQQFTLNLRALARY